MLHGDEYDEMEAGYAPEEDELEGAFSIAKRSAGMEERGMPGAMELEDLLGPDVGLNEQDEYSQDAYDTAMTDMQDEYGEVMSMDDETSNPAVKSDMQDLLATKAQERLARSEQYQQEAADNSLRHTKGY